MWEVVDLFDEKKLETRIDLGLVLIDLLSENEDLDYWVNEQNGGCSATLLERRK